MYYHKGVKRYRNLTVLVKTHKAEDHFRYLEWLDQSPEQSAVDYVK